MTFRVQIALYGAAVVGVALLVFSLLSYGLAAGALNMTQDRDLTQRGERLLGSLSVAGADAFTIQHLFTASEVSDSNDAFVELVDAEGHVMWTTGTLNGAPPVQGATLTRAARADPTLTTLTTPGGQALRLYIRPWSRPDLNLAGYIVVGQAVRGLQSVQAGIRGFLWLSGIFTFLAALIAIWLVAGRALRPLQLVAATAEDIRVTGDLRRRLPESRGWVELNRLARAFNGMLERLDLAQQRLANALETQRRFVADASHELRTPLTTIQTNAGLLLRRSDVSAEDRAAALGDIASEAERMGRLVQDLLTLARADAGQPLELGPLDLGVLVAQVGRQAGRVYADRAVAVACELNGAAHVAGNADALRQLQWILVDNAARFAGTGGHVCLALSTRNGAAELSVSDDGPGIPPADRERIFDRFYRADLARAGGGAGLGLSIARWIVDQHHGTIRADENPAGRGAIFRVELPLLVNS